MNLHRRKPRTRAVELGSPWCAAQGQRERQAVQIRASLLPTADMSEGCVTWAIGTLEAGIERPQIDVIDRDVRSKAGAMNDAARGTSPLFRPVWPRSIQAAARQTGFENVVVGPAEVRRHEAELRASLANEGCVWAQTEWSAVIGNAGLAKLVRRGDLPRGNSVLLRVTDKNSRLESRPLQPDAVITPDYDPELLLEQPMDGEVTDDPAS